MIYDEINMSASNRHNVLCKINFHGQVNLVSLPTILTHAGV